MQIVVDGREVPYTTVSTVCSSTLLWCLVDLDVLDDQVAGIETLGIGVCLCVLEKSEEELSRLYWPSCAGDTELLSCTSSPISTSPFDTCFLISSSYLVQHVRFRQHIFALGQPLCGSERSQGMPKRACCIHL